MTTDIFPQSAVDIDKTRVSLDYNVRQFNYEQQVFPLQEDTGYVREFAASLTELHQKLYCIQSELSHVRDSRDEIPF